MDISSNGLPAYEPWQPETPPKGSLSDWRFSIDGLNTLIHGQKLPLFSQHPSAAANPTPQIARQARVRGTDAVSLRRCVCNHGYCLRRQTSSWRSAFPQTGAILGSVMFINIQLAQTHRGSIIAAPCWLCVAEYLAFLKRHAHAWLS